MTEQAQQNIRKVILRRLNMHFFSDTLKTVITCLSRHRADLITDHFTSQKSSHHWASVAFLVSELRFFCVDLEISNFTRRVKKKFQKDKQKSRVLELEFHLCQLLQGVAVCGLGVHKDRTCQPIAWWCQTHPLLYTVPDKLPSGVRGTQHRGHVDGGEEGGALSPQPLELLVAGHLHVRTAARVVLQSAPVVVIVAVREQVEPPQLVGPQALGVPQGFQHELPGRHLKFLLGHFAHLFWRPCWVLLTHQLTRMFAVNIFCFPVTYPEWAPGLPINNCQALGPWFPYILLHSLRHLLQVLSETGHLRQPPIHCCFIWLEVWVWAQAIFIEDGKVLPNKALIGWGHDLEFIQLKAYTMPRATVLSRGIPSEEQRLFRIQWPSRGLQSQSTKAVPEQHSQKQHFPVRQSPVQHVFRWELTDRTVAFCSTNHRGERYLVFIIIIVII